MAEVTADRGHDVRNDPCEIPYVVLAGTQGGGPTARAAQQARDNELAEFFRSLHEEIVEAAKERLAQREAER